jgi:hypothetical protein
VVNVLVEFNLVYSTFMLPNAVSHRTEWNRLAIYGQPNIKLFLYYIYADMQHTQYHAGAMYTLPIIVGALIAKFVFKIKLTAPILILAGMIGFIAFWDAFNLTLLKLAHGRLNFVESFSTERFIFIAPFLWLLLLGLVLHGLDFKRKVQQAIAAALVLVTLGGILVHNREAIYNAKLLTGGDLVEPTFKQFFAEDLFAELKATIGPANAQQYNTLSTVA